MSKRYARIIEYNRRFFRYGWHVKEMIALHLIFIALGGIVIAKIEGISSSDGIYFSFVTGLTIGYGDIAPATTWGRVLSVVVGLLGTLFAGLIVAIASRALHDTIQRSGEGDR